MEHRTKIWALAAFVWLMFCVGAGASPMWPHYAMDMTLNYKQRAYQGTSVVTLPALRSPHANAVYFHLYANAFAPKDAPLLSVDSVSSDDRSLAFTQNETLLTINLPADKSTFNRSSPLRLRLNWHGTVPEVSTPSDALTDLMSGGLMAQTVSSAGEYRDYGLYSFRNGILSLGSYWYPILAVRDGDSWQTEVLPGPGDILTSESADYEVSVTVNEAPANLSIISAAAATTENVLHASLNAARDFALVLGEDFEEQTQTLQMGKRAIKVSSWARRANAEKSVQAARAAAEALRIFSARFGAYPRDRFTLVQGSLSGGAGGAEFSGMGVIAQALYADLEGELRNKLGALGAGNIALGTVAQQQFGTLGSLFETSIAHEVAHQWWAMAVGSDVRRDPWLDECLASYSGMLYYLDRYGKEKYEEMVQVNLRQPYQMARMLGISDAPVSGSSNQFENDLQYGAIIYGKGALFYQALRQLLGDDAFNAAMQKYFSANRGKMVTEKELLDALSQAAPAKRAAITNLYQRWIKEEHGDQDVGVMSLGDLLGM